MTATTEEYEKFKEEVFKRMMEVEKSVVMIQPKILESKMNDILGKLDKYTERLDQIEAMANKDKVIIETVHDLKTHVWESQQTITNHEVKLNGLAKDVKDSIAKYDKIYLENLFLPGIIGESSCRFKNMKEFIEYDLENLSQLLNFRETVKTYMNMSTERHDNFTKNVRNQLENMDVGMKNYVKTMIEVEKTNSKTEFKVVDEKIGAVKLENHKYALEIKKSSDELKAERETVIKVKSEVEEKVDTTHKHMQDLTNNTLDKFYRLQSEYDAIKSKFTELAEWVKDIRFKKNLNELTMLEMKQIANKITFERNHHHQPTHSSTNHPVYTVNHNKGPVSPETLPNINPPSFFTRPELHKLSAKEKEEVATKIKLDSEENRLNFHKKQSNSNTNLPHMPIDRVDDNKLSHPVISINYTERTPQVVVPTQNNNSSQEEIVLKTEGDVKSKTFYNNAISKTKVNFDKNAQMSSTNYNSNPTRSVVANTASETTRNNTKENKYRYVKPKQPPVQQKNYKFSVEKLEPDFSFKTTQLSFDPMSGMNKKGNSKNVIVEFNGSRLHPNEDKKRCKIILN